MNRGPQPHRVELRECARCGELHQRKHTWCLTCNREADRRRARAMRSDGTTSFERYTSYQGPKAPPPPPGFDPRDLKTGKPLA